jgi:hypothetical protein
MSLIVTYPFLPFQHSSYTAELGSDDSLLALMSLPLGFPRLRNARMQGSAARLDEPFLCCSIQGWSAVARE